MSEQGLRAGFYGDDFTGSVDALLQFAREGWHGRLFVGVPSGEALAAAAADSEVIGIAGIARSLPTAALEAEVRPALEALRALGAGVVQYKACSTADSSPEIGSLGRVVEIGRDVFGETTVPMLFAQPAFGRYTVFGHHFAAEGGSIHRLDRQPTMSNHPSTPMTESDLAVHLSRQTALPIEAITHLAYDGTLRDRLLAHHAAAVVLDAVDDDDISTVGAAVAALPAPTFAIGSGGLSTGLARATATPAGELARSTPARGPVLAVSGSRSPRTREQMDAAIAAGWLVRPLQLPCSGLADEVVAALQAGTSVALTSDDAVLEHADIPSVLEAIAVAAASVVRTVVRAGATHRVIVCGGDTSSRVTKLLGVESLSIAANPWDNVVICTAHSAEPAIDGLELLLKGGQVGGVDLFEQVRLLGA